MSKSFLNRQQQQTTRNTNFNEIQKKIDPVAQLKWLNDLKVDCGWGIYGDNGETTQMLSNKNNQKQKSEIKDQGWDYTIDNEGNTNVSVNLNFSVDNELGLTEEQIVAYKTAISNQLNITLKDSFGEKYSGKVIFEGGKESGQVIPTLNIYGKKAAPGSEIMIGGMSTNAYSSINIYNKEGSFRSPENIAVTAIHELLHTLRLEHPFEKTQGDDTKLLHQGGDNYSSTTTTDPNILYNIMNYSLINIDDKNAGDTPLTLLTQDQLIHIKNEIDLQKNGYGLTPNYNTNLSPKENENVYKKLYFDYWNNTPGQDVPKKK